MRPEIGFRARKIATGLTINLELIYIGTKIHEFPYSADREEMIHSGCDEKLQFVAKNERVAWRNDIVTSSG